MRAFCVTRWVARQRQGRSTLRTVHCLVQRLLLRPEGHRRQPVRFAQMHALEVVEGAGSLLYERPVHLHGV